MVYTQIFQLFDGIQIKQKELTKTAMMILNWKNPLVSMVFTKIFQRFRG